MSAALFPREDWRVRRERSEPMAASLIVRIRLLQHRRGARRWALIMEWLGGENGLEELAIVGSTACALENTTAERAEELYRQAVRRVVRSRECR